MARSYANTKDGIRRLNTKVTSEAGCFSVRLYATTVYAESGGYILLNHGGWVTPTTTSRIHQALRHRGHMNNVNIKNGVMHCDGKPFDADGTFTVKIEAREVA